MYLNLSTLLPNFYQIKTHDTHDSSNKHEYKQSGKSVYLGLDPVSVDLELHYFQNRIYLGFSINRLNNEQKLPDFQSQLVKS